MARVCFVSLPLMDYAVHTTVHEKIMPSIGLAYLATVAKSMGHEVRLIDAEVRKLPLDRLSHDIAEWAPDIVGISIPSPLLVLAKRLVHYLSMRKLETTIVVGGVHPTVVREQIFREIPAVDVAFVKEAEGSFAQYLRGEPLSSIKGIIFRDDQGRLVNNGEPECVDINELPFIDRELVENDPWEADGRKESYVCSSRGCPFRCTFCSGGLLQGKHIRQRAVSSVIEEIRLLVDKYHVNYIHFVDDNFVISRSRAIEFCNALVREQLDIRWRFLARAGVLHRWENYEFEMLKAAGCDLIGIGIESGSQRICDRIKKEIRLEWIPELVAKATKAGIRTKGFFILGFPFEDTNDIEQTRTFILTSGLSDVNISLLRVFPGTALYDELLQTHSQADLDDYLQHTGVFAAEDYAHDRLKKAELYMLSHFVNLNATFSVEELAEISRDIYRRFYAVKANTQHNELPLHLTRDNDND